jgi:hypothetical protein
MAHTFTEQHQYIPDMVSGLIHVERIWTVDAGDLALDETFALLRLPGAVGGVGKVRIDKDSIVCTLTDMDAGALLVWDLGLGDSDGVLDTVLISGSTVGQAAGSDFADNRYGAATNQWQAAEGKWLIWEITTAATANGLAGTFKLEFSYFRGVNVDTVKLTP